MGWVNDKGKDAVQKFELGGRVPLVQDKGRAKFKLAQEEMELAMEAALRAKRKAKKTKTKSLIGKKEGIGPYFRSKDKPKKKEDKPRTDAMKKGLIKALTAAGKKRIG